MTAVETRVVYRNHDECPMCGNFTVPQIAVDSEANAAVCRECGYVVKRSLASLIRAAAN